MTDRIGVDRRVIVKDCARTPPSFQAKDWAYIDEDPEPFTEDCITLYKI